MSRHVPQRASLDPIELAVWAAEFVRARNKHVNPTTLVIDNALRSANSAVDDLRKAYKR